MLFRYFVIVIIFSRTFLDSIVEASFYLINKNIRTKNEYYMWQFAFTSWLLFQKHLFVVMIRKIFLTLTSKNPLFSFRARRTKERTESRAKPHKVMSREISCSLFWSLIGTSTVKMNSCLRHDSAQCCTGLCALYESPCGSFEPLKLASFDPTVDVQIV